VARRKFKAGMIVWARVPDRNGVVKPNPRPVVITSVHPSVKNAPFVAYAVSTRPEKDTDEPIFPLPCDPQTGGTTGFYQWCALVLRWQLIVEPDQVDETIPFGHVPPDVFEAILRAIEDAKIWPLPEN
jgi:hypothetical protein